jgi:hypothetical protein
VADERPADDPALATAARHALHDEELVAAFAAGDEEADAARARSLIDRCVTCADLARDIEAITGAVRSLDDAATASAYVKAPRDFRIIPEGAAPARPTGIRARLAAALGGLATFARPVGATLATFGLVGLLVGTVSLGPLGGSPAMAPGPGFGTSAPGAGDHGSGPGGAPEATEDTRSEYQPLSSSGDPQLGPTSPEVGRPAPAPVSLLFAGSVAALVLGAALLWVGSSRRPTSSERAS